MTRLGGGRGGTRRGRGVRGVGRGGGRGGKYYLIF